jgi:hypothetical protein
MLAKNAYKLMGFFPIQEGRLHFLNRVDEEHHMTDKISLITEVPNIYIVNDFPLDYMHLVC